MTLRAADLRFVLPHSVTTARVVDEDVDDALAAIADGLRTAGVSCQPRKAPVDLVVAAAQATERALSIPAMSHLILGRVDPKVVRRSGRAAMQLLVLGRSDRPTALVPTESAASLVYYLRRLAAPVDALHDPLPWMRNRAATALLRSGVPVSRFMSGSRVATVLLPGHDRQQLPHLLSVADRADARRRTGTSWVLALGTGDDLQRAVFHVLDRGQVSRVVKFSRVRGATDAFDRDEVGLKLAHSAGVTVSAHAPSLLVRFEVDELSGSMETAVPGGPLVRQLARRPQSLVDSIAQWIVEFGVLTAVPPERLEPERRRLSTDVLPAWVSHGVPTDLLTRLPPIPGVLQHNDLGSWNIVTNGREFSAVDWESARAVGMPLWDLFYFLADALVRMEGPADALTMQHRCLALFRGGSPYSSTLFAWVRVAAARLRIPPEVVGPLATLCWTHHGLSAKLRQSALAGAPPAEPGHLAGLAAPWLADRDLGLAWSRWRSD